MEFIVLLVLGIPAIFVIRWLLLRGRFRNLEQRIAILEQQVERLSIARAAAPVEKPAPARPVPIPVAAPPPPPPVVEKAFCQWCGRQLYSAATVCNCRDAAVPEMIPEAQAPPPPVVENAFCQWCGRRLYSSSEICNCRDAAIPRPAIHPEIKPEPVLAPAAQSFSERLREKLGGEEWEALVGVNLTNKIGALVLVMGIASLLGYSFVQMGPAGRAAIGLAVSIAMLVSGFFVERREKYRIFATGLLGGGWAALYFTTYAMQAIDAAKVIESPLVGGVLLVAVAAGMIAHSLRYRSQGLTGLAYFVAFVTLAITPVTTLSIVALIPLAASLLYVAHRFEWSKMAVFGLVATYGTLISRGDSGAPAWQAQIVFTLFWLLFEGFDLLRAARRTEYELTESTVMPLNAIAFGGLSYLKWTKSAPGELYLIAAAVAAGYLASAVLRTRLRPLSSFTDRTTVFERMLSGSYEGPITIGAALSAAAVLLRFHNQWANFGLLAEAECLFVAGLYFRQRYLQQLGSALFGVNFVKLFALDVPQPGLPWVPSTSAAGALFYLNRFLDRPATTYGYAATAVCALLIGVEMPEAHLGVTWFAFAAILFAFGFVRKLEDFRFQAYGVAALAFAGIAWHQASLQAGTAAPSKYPWFSLAASALLAYAGAWCALRSAPGRLGERERSGLQLAASWAVTALCAALVWRSAPPHYLGVGWLLVALALLELGIRSLPFEFRRQAFLLACLGAAAVFILNVIPIRNDSPVAERVIPALAALAAYAFAARLYIARESEKWVNAASAAATLFLCTGLWALLPAPAVGPAFAAVALLLIEGGLALSLTGIVKQGHVVAAASFGRLFAANFVTSGAVGLVSHRLATVLPVAAAFYHLWSRLGARKVARYYLHAASILIFVLIRFELGRTLAVDGWAAMAVILLVLGRRWNISDLRWQSYIAAALAFARSLSTSFYSPESFSGAAARAGTGAFIIACFYAAQLLVPQIASRTGIERYARVYFSLLATALTTVLLYHEVSGSVLTLAWGVESIALLIAGFPLRDRTLRISGLFLFLLCVLKLFLYDLRNLDTAYRIVSFIVLGLMLLSVSWIYTRFRDRIQRYL